MAVHSCPYELQEHREQVVEDELRAMFDMGYWCRPVVTVTKEDSTLHFCMDYMFCVIHAVTYLVRKILPVFTNL